MKLGEISSQNMCLLFTVEDIDKEYRSIVSLDARSIYDSLRRPAAPHV